MLDAGGGMGGIPPMGGGTGGIPPMGGGGGGGAPAIGGGGGGGAEVGPGRPPEELACEASGGAPSEPDTIPTLTAAFVTLPAATTRGRGGFASTTLMKDPLAVSAGDLAMASSADLRSSFPRVSVAILSYLMRGASGAST